MNRENRIYGQALRVAVLASVAFIGIGWTIAAQEKEDAQEIEGEGEIAIRGLPNRFSLTTFNGQRLASPDFTGGFTFGVFESDILLGAGTVSTVHQADRAIGAGARFIVAPGVNPGVVEHVAKQDIPIFPGVCTPTDIETAISLGLSVPKLFPVGAMGGLKLLKALAAPYGHLVKFIPTGGVTAANLRDYLAEPSVIACGGSWIVAKGLVEAGSFAEISELTKQAMEIVKNAAGERA